MRSVKGSCCSVWLRESDVEVLPNGCAASDLSVEERRSNLESHRVLLRMWLVTQGVRLEGFLGGHGSDAREKLQREGKI